MDMRERIEAALDQVRPALQMDGGDVEYLDFKDGEVYLRLLGTCGGCSMSSMTLKVGIEATLRQMVPEVHTVIAI